MDDAAIDSLLLAATSLAPDGVRSQWLAPVIAGEQGVDVAASMRGLEAAGLVEFRDDALHVTDTGRARLAAESHDAAAVHGALARGIARSSYDSGSVREQLAYHLACSGDAERAIAVLVARATAALRTCEPILALHALDQAAQIGALDHEARALHARCAKLGGDPRSVELWQLALASAHEAGDDVAAARAAIELTFLGALAPDALTQHVDAPSGWGSYVRGLDHYFNAAWTEAIDALEQALASARTRDDLELETAALRLLGNAHAGIGHLELSARVMRDAIRVADLASDPFTTAIAYMGLVETLLEALHTAEAGAAAAELERYLRTRGIERLLPLAFALRAAVALASGDFDAAFELARRGIADVVLDQVTNTDGYVANVLADAIAATGFAGAVADAAMQRVAQIVDAFEFASAADHLELARAWRARNAGDEAPLLQLAADIDADAELVDCAAIATLLTRTAVIDGRAAPASSLTRLRSADAARCPLAGLAWREVDALAAADIAALDEVIDAWQRAGRRYDAAMATLARARLLHAQGDGAIEDAERAALLALRELVAAGAAPDADRARALIATLGRMPVDPSGLLGCSAFAHLDARVLTQLVHASHRLDIAAGDVVPTRIDDDEIGIVIIGDGMALVVEGAGAAAAADDPIIAVRCAGDAHVDSWYRAQVATAASRAGDHAAGTSLVAATTLTAWAIPAAALRAACVADARLIGALLAIADDDAADVRRLAAELATLDFTQRLARLLLRLQERRGRATLHGEAMIDAVITNEQLARMCGSQRPRVSTLLTSWRRDGIIDTWKRRIVILDSAQLRIRAGIAEDAGEQDA